MPHKLVRRHQRELFFSGLIVAALPVLIQLAIAGLIWSEADASRYEEGRRIVGAPTFWLSQIITLSVAMAGSSVVSYIRTSKKIVIAKPFVGMRLVIVVAGIALQALVIAMSLLLGSGLGYWMIGMAALGIGMMIVAYYVDMDLALMEAGLMTGEPVR